MRVLSVLSSLAPYSIRIEEHRAHVGTVNARVANGAGLVLRRLVVSRPERLAGGKVRRRRVTLQADSVNVRAIQQARIRSPVGEVAGGAAFGPDHVVLIDKWA